MKLVIALTLGIFSLPRASTQRVELRAEKRCLCMKPSPGQEAERVFPKEAGGGWLSEEAAGVAPSRQAPAAP